ncbi:hypothetical protein SRHO_G00275910 [Serrasalmus rhombeus]
MAVISIVCVLKVARRRNQTIIQATQADASTGVELETGSKRDERINYMTQTCGGCWESKGHDTLTFHTRAG